MKWLVLLIPFAGTSLGASTVFFMRQKLSEHLEKALSGFAAGVMIAASVWSLLIPAIDMTKEQGTAEVWSWIPAVVGFLLGIGFLLLLDMVIPHLHPDSKKPEGLPSKLPKNTMMLFAVTLHNIPEGMAVGVAYAGAAAAHVGLSLAGAAALSLGIAIQNIPEGAIISLPLRSAGKSRGKSFLYGVLSGVVEPVGGFLTILFVSHMMTVLPYLLAFAAGAMMYVVVDELIPEAQTGEHSNIGTIGSAFGFALMMLLDVALG